MKKIQATIIGYGGEPCTVLSAYDEETRVLVVSLRTKFRPERIEGCVVVTNDTNIQRDELFTEDRLREAIEAFFLLKNGVASDGGSSRLTYSDSTGNTTPDNAIEKDGVTDSGARYRIAEGVTCAQIAVLATCLHAIRSETIERTVSFAEQLASLSSGVFLTI